MRTLGLRLSIAILLLASSAQPAFAQTPTAVLTAGSGSGLAGDTGVSVPVSLSNTNGSEVAGLNFDLSFDPSRVSINDVTIGNASGLEDKSLSYSQPSSGVVRVIIFGLNQTLIGNGTVANVIFDVSGSASPGTFSLTLSNVAVTDGDGDPVANSLNNGSFTVLAPTATPTNTSPPPTATNTKPPPTATDVPPSATPTRTPTSSGPTNTPSRTPTPTVTPTPGPSSTPTRTPTPSPTPTRTLATATPEATAEGTAGAGTAEPKGGERSADPEAAASTATAEAELDAAVAQTATAIASPEPTLAVSGVVAVTAMIAEQPQWAVVVGIGSMFLILLLLLRSSLRAN